MSLIARPQDGCEQQVSLTAKACPNCGFAVHDFFLEDLRGFDTNSAMRRFDHWVDNKDGTITDTRSKLTWPRAPYGLEWNGMEHSFPEKPLSLIGQKPLPGLERGAWLDTPIIGLIKVSCNVKEHSKTDTPKDLKRRILVAGEDGDSQR